MRIILAIFLIFIGVQNAFAACGGSSPNLTAASAARDDVMACVTASTYGDTITVPTGSVTWAAASQGCTGNSMLCVKKGVKIVGQSVTVTLSGAATYGAICYEPDATSISTDEPFEISGFTIDAGGTDYAEGMIDVRNGNTTAITKVRIYSNTFRNGAANGHGIVINGPVYGVAHENTFLDIGTPIKVEGGNKNSWNLGHGSYGTANAFYYEDNTESFSEGTAVDDFGSTAGQGGSLVYRYNTINSANNTTGNEMFDLHGLQSMSTSNASCNGGCSGTSCYCETTGGTRCCNEWSQVKSELYGNLYTNLGNTEGGYSYSVVHRGSKMLMFNNKYTGTYSGGSVPQPKYREYACDECQNPAGENSGSDYVQHINSTYVFNNFYNGTDYPLVGIGSTLADKDYCAAGVGTYTITENRDYFNKAASFDGTVGLGCGTLAARPATCTTGVGYWATTQSCSDLTDYVGASPTTPISGTLYKCTSTNTWEAYYTPYTYPHPLRGEGGTTHTVTISADANCTITPAAGNQTVSDGGTQVVSMVPSYGYVASGTGTCGGTLSSTTYTSSAVSGDCTIHCTATPRLMTLGGSGTITTGGSGSITFGN